MTTVPGCFACHVDCATGCATDDQPYNHPAFVNYKYHPPSFDEDGLRSRNASVESSLSEKGVGVERSDTQGTEQGEKEEEEASGLMRFVLWALDVKTDTGA